MNDEFLILLAISIGAYLFLMPLIALIIAKNAFTQTRKLRAEIELLKLSPQAPTPENPIQKTVAVENTKHVKTEAPVADTKIESDLAQKTPAPPKPEKPKAPSFWGRMMTNIQANWIIWLAALSLAFGGLFIVQYGLERGFLGPVARVICALVFGAGLLAVAEYLRRLPKLGLEGWFTVPVALAAGGIASLFGGVVSAHILYDLTSPLVGFASMALVSFLAVATGLIFGPVLAVIGILGAFISPALVSTGEGHTIMYLYFLMVLISALVIERMRKWIWLSSLAVVFTYLAGLALNDALPNQPYLALYLIAVILAVTTIPAFGIRPKWGHTELINEKTLGNVATHYPTILTVITVAAGVAILCLVANNSLILWQASLLALLGLCAWSIYWCAHAQNLDQLPLIFATGLMFSATVERPYQIYNASGSGAAHFYFVAAIMMSTAALFLFATFWRTPRSVRPLYWVASGAVAPVLIYFLTYASWREIAPINANTWVFIALLLALMLVASALMMLRSRIRQRRMASDLLFSGMLITVSYVAYLTIEPEYLAHIAALLSLAALSLVSRFKYKWTGYLIVAFVAAATSFIVFDLFPDYALQKPVLLVVALFGVAILLFGAGYKMANHAKLPHRAVLYETAALLSIALLICTLIARFASGGKWEFGYMVLGLYATVWILLAGVQFKRRLTILDGLTHIRQYLGYGYGLLGLGALALSLIMSPLILDKVKGIFPLDTIMVAYALPMLAAYGLYHFNLLPSFISRKIALGFTGILAGFIAIQEVRRFWHGPIIRFEEGVKLGELYTYTVLLLVATLSTVVLAITRDKPHLRKVGLALAGLTAAKVFLWDTAGMQGLARASVFIALGLTLAGIGWLLQTPKNLGNADT